MAASSEINPYLTSLAVEHSGSVDGDGAGAASHVSADTARTQVAAVILAAGEGSRLGQPSKPLARVAGVSLLERAVDTVRAAGIERVIVVVGHAKEAVAEFVASRRLDVALVDNERFSVGNGSSAVAGGQVAGERFLLMMGDHLVEPAAIERMIRSRAEFAVAVDTNPMFCDVDEATKVTIADGAVVAVDRNLDHCDGVDAGIFVCDRSVVETAERALAEGEGTWNAVKRRWIAEGRRLDAVDVTGSIWIDVDTPDDVRRAERLLVSRAAAKPRDGLVSRRLNRPLSRRISLLLVRAGVSPTAVTVATFAATVVAAVVVALGGRWSAALVLGGVLVQLASIVDGCDGEVARTTLRASPAGAFLDTVLDRIADVALLAALGVAAGLDAATWAVLLVAVVLAFLVPYTSAAFEGATRRPFPPLPLSFGRDARLLVIAVGAVLLQPFWALVAVAAVSAAEAAGRTVTGYRSARSV